MDELEFKQEVSEDISQENTVSDENVISSNADGEIQNESENEALFEAENNETAEEINGFEPQEEIPKAETSFAEFKNTPVYNSVNYSPVEPVTDYKPMSRGLKVFSLIMAAVIALTGACVVGYFSGRNSIKLGSNSVSKSELASRPKKTDQLTEAQVYEKVNESVVGIVIYNSKGIGSQASGIVYSEDGYIVTNDHIYSEVPSAKFKIYAHDGREYEATYVAGDKISDLAVLKVKGAKLKPAEFGNSDEVFYGEHVVAIGRPNDATDNSSITRGVISAINRRVQTTSSYSSRLIQTDSAINPGSSGGALVNMYGQVVGVTSSKLASVEYDAVGYAIPTTVMKRIVDELIKEKKVVSRAKLGITYTAVDSVVAEIQGYDYVGLLLDTVDEESNLYGKAEKGDIITHINGVEVTSDVLVLDIIEESSAGDKVKVTIVTQEGKSKTVEVELKANVSESSYSNTESNKEESNILEKDPDIFGKEDDSSNGGGIFNFPFGE